MAYIGPLPAETFTSFATQEFSTSATTSYTLNHPVTNENELALFINNVRQQPGSGKAYTATGTALTLSEATASTDTMYAVFLGRALQTVNPAGGSVGASQVADNLISGKTELASTPADTDEFLVSDAGTIKRVDYSLIKSEGDMVKLAQTNVTSDVSSVDFINGTGGVVIDSTYRIYKIFASYKPADNGRGLQFRLINAGSNVRTSGYLNRAYRSYYTDGQSGQSSTAYLLSQIGGTQNASEQRSNYEATFYNMSDSGLNTTAYGLNAAIDGSSNTENQVNTNITSGVYTTAEAHNGIRMIMDSGNVGAGEFTLYGIKG